MKLSSEKLVKLPDTFADGSHLSIRRVQCFPTRYSGNEKDIPVPVSLKTKLFIFGMATMQSMQRPFFQQNIIP